MKNGNGKYITIVLSLVVLVGICIGWGALFNGVSTKADTAHRVAIKAAEQSHTNEKTIIGIKGDIEYIKEAVKEIKERGK